MKTKLAFETREMYGADLGENNPLPNFCATDIHSKIAFDKTISEEESKYYNYGAVNGILPYLFQDGYNRKKTLNKYECVVLENEHLRATFFPQFGGKLWSLFDKDEKRELLNVNPVFQPANLAIRNAWCSGGVEWNIGMAGHTPYTLSQLHTSVLEMSDGTPVLRMYEWERIRRVSYQIDAYLPENSHYLFVKIHLCNTCNEEVPIYWWSNIAVNETDDTRVIVPADEAFCFDYGGIISKKSVPIYEGIDSSYTTRISRAMDLFYDIKPKSRKWEAVLDSKGEGLIETSTDTLQGRKLFMWGNGSGGKHWQDFLSVEGNAYLEIQAGLANTQMENLPMPANAKWEWLEAYGMMKANPQKVHSNDWKEAYLSVDEQLEKDLPRLKLDMELKRFNQDLKTSAKQKTLGSGWAALELKRLNRSETFEGEEACFLEKSMNDEQTAWCQLLQKGTFPNRDVREIPASYVTQKEWIVLLENAIKTDESSNNWHAWLQLGVMYGAQEDASKACECFEKSLELSENSWAKRNIAAFETIKGNVDIAANLLLEAVKLLPIIQMEIECGKALIKAKRFHDFETFYYGLPEKSQKHCRLLVMLIEVSIELEKFDIALNLLENGISVDDMREGETLLSDLWIELYSRKAAKLGNFPVDSIDDEVRKQVLLEHPLPKALDFRMKD